MSKLSASSSAPSTSTLRLGFLALTDAAPLIVAEHHGIFARHGLKVALQREVGWATICEKIIYGELDAAPAPAPMLWSAQLGIGGASGDVLTAFVFNRNGNALTLSNRLYEAGITDPVTLRAEARRRRGESRITLGVVHPFSSHHLHVHQWLLAAGIDPQTQVRMAVVPPAQMFRNLEVGTIDGYCAGEPWNSIAVRANAGWCPMWSAAHDPQHIEKVLMVTERFATHRAAEHSALIAALAEAAAWCDKVENREELATILGAAKYLNLPTRVITPALLGQFDCGHGRIENISDFVIFHRGEANVPALDKAQSLQSQLIAAGMLSSGIDAQLPARLFREDLYREALKSNYTHETVPNTVSGIALQPSRVA